MIAKGSQYRWENPEPFAIMKPVSARVWMSGDAEAGETATGRR